MIVAASAGCYAEPVTPIALQALTPAELAARVPGVTLPDARRIVAQVHRGEDPRTPSSSIRRIAREAVVAAGHVPTLAVTAREASAIDPFVKYALRAEDGSVFEAVRIPLERAGRFSVCVSSQVGCALACAFCATGRLGLARNLEAWEIVEQVRVVRREVLASSLGRVHGVVFQGMGEPLANLDRVLAAIAVLTEPCALAIDARAITVCTSGLPTGIRRLAREAPNVRLGWSIGSARPAARRSLMPIEGSHPLRDVFDAGVAHARETGNAPMWAYTLLAGVNDGDDDARALAELVLAFREGAGVSPRLSLIPYNSVGPRDPFSRAAPEREAAFRDVLAAEGVGSHRRYSGGADVRAACGQLAGAG